MFVVFANSDIFNICLFFLQQSDIELIVLLMIINNFSTVFIRKKVFLRFLKLIDSEFKISMIK